jgi:DNA-binding beta-propeller fold protein YncE
MNIPNRLRNTFGFGAITLALMGCGGSESPLGQGVSRLNAAPVAVAHRGSWMSPDAKQSDLLYVSDLTTGDVDVFSYPRGKPKGKLTGFNAPHGECVDAKGNVFITSAASSQIFEYSHAGTKPIATLSDPGYTPSDCSIDPVTGDLAVANLLPLGSGSGSVAIYKRAKGKPKLYIASSALFMYYSCSFDGSGNLFVDGSNMNGNQFEIAELPKGATALVAVTLNQQIAIPGGVQWDGKYLAVGDQVCLDCASTIYEFSMSGSTGTKVGETNLSNSCDVIRFWLQGKRVIAPNDCAPNIMYFKYPAGGNSTKTITGVSQVVGATVSQAPRI